MSLSNFSNKLDSFDKSQLSLVDLDFVKLLEEDLHIFISTTTDKRVLIFPPVNNYRRFLIHKVVEVGFTTLKTFSIGEEERRRTVVCFLANYINNAETILRPSNKRKMPALGIYASPATRTLSPKKDANTEDLVNIGQKNDSRSEGRRRRPDRQVYVPRARRLAEQQQKSLQKEQEECFVLPVDPIEELKSSSVITESSVVVERDTSNISALPENAEIISSFSQLSSVQEKPLGFSTNQSELPGSETSTPICTDQVLSSVHHDQSKLIISKTDIIDLSDDDLTLVTSTNDSVIIDNKKEALKTDKNVDVNTKMCSEEKIDDLSDDWDSLYDENGECLDDKLMCQLTASVGKVKIEKPTAGRYSNFVESACADVDEKYPHVVEVSGFSAEFKTHDLLMVFSSFPPSVFTIRWVDDTHALVVFNSTNLAIEALRMHHPLVTIRTLSSASSASQAKARRVAAAGSLCTNEPRPDTCAALARRMVSAALGVRTPTRRPAEELLLAKAREKKRLAAKQREDVWEGVFADASATT